MVLPIIENNPAVGVMGQLQNISASRTQQRATKASIPGIEAASSMKTQEAKEYLSDLNQRTRKKQQESAGKVADYTGADAESKGELIPVVQEAEEAKLVRQTLQDTAGIVTDEEAINLNTVATATQEGWATTAQELNKKGEFNFTGDWEKDKQAREQYIASGVSTIKQRQAMQVQQVQLQVAELYANKVPEFVQLARTAYPNDVEMQNQKIQELMQAEIDALTNKGKTTATPRKMNVESPSKIEQGIGSKIFDQIAPNVPKIAGLSKEQQKRFKLAAMMHAKVLEARVGEVGGAVQGGFDSLYATAMKDLLQYVQPVEQSNIGPVTYGPKSVFTPPADMQLMAEDDMAPEARTVQYNLNKDIDVTNHPYTDMTDLLKAVRNKTLTPKKAAEIAKDNGWKPNR